MPEKARYNEPLRDLAPEAYRLSQFLCGPCRDLHGLWPYIRLSRASTGVEAPESRLQDELRILFDRGLRRLLIAGAQDTGLLALMVRASAGHNVEITVLDICETPLELCRGLAKQWSLSIATIRQDLFDFRVERHFDIVLMHGTLHFIAADRRLEVLRRIRHALHPTGRLIVLFNTSHPVSTDLDSQTGDDYASTVLSELKKLAVPLPESEAVMRERLTAHQRRRETREGAFAKPRDLELLLNQAGFCLQSCVSIDVTVAAPIQKFIASITKRRHLAIAAVRSLDERENGRRKRYDDDRT
jgi:SAM-dependent methyltransferase